MYSFSLRFEENRAEMRKTVVTLLFAPSSLLLQGWGGAAKGGWGDDSSESSSGGWGKPAATRGGWGDEGGSSGRGRSDDGGWGKPPGRRDDAGNGGWGSGAPKKSWGGGDGGWGSAPTGASRGRGRGFGGETRGGPGGFGGRSRGSSRSDSSNVWGSPTTVDADAWSTAPPSFTPPVRRVDPLTLTAVEVEIDGIKKLVGQRVLITGLSDDTTWHILKDHLRQVGEVTYCRIFSSGRAMVEFVTPEEAARAITELQASELQGATLFLREDREDTVLINTRRKIREARDAQLRARKEEEEAKKVAQARAEGDVTAGQQ